MSNNGVSTQSGNVAKLLFLRQLQLSGSKFFSPERIGWPPAAE